MFVIDGIAYAGEPVADLRIEDAKVVNDLCMVVRFSTGEERVFDATPLLVALAFAPLRDQAVFSNAKIEHGILTWLNGDSFAELEARRRQYAYYRDKLLAFPEKAA